MMMNFDIPDWIDQGAVEKQRLAKNIVTSQKFIDKTFKEFNEEIDKMNLSENKSQKTKVLVIPSTNKNYF